MLILILLLIPPIQKHLHILRIVITHQIGRVFPVLRPQIKAQVSEGAAVILQHTLCDLLRRDPGTVEKIGDIGIRVENSVTYLIYIGIPGLLIRLPKIPSLGVGGISTPGKIKHGKGKASQQIEKPHPPRSGVGVLPF